MANNILPQSPAQGKAPALATKAEAIAARITRTLAELEAGRQAIAAIEAPPTFVDRIIAKFGGRR